MSGRRHNSSDEKSGDSGQGGNLTPAAILSLLLRKKSLFIFLIICAMITVSVMHFWLPVYEARASLSFQGADSSPLQAVSTQMSAAGMQEDPFREQQRYISKLVSPVFFTRAAQELRATGEDLPMFHYEMRSSRQRVLWGVKQLLHIPTVPSSLKDIDDDEIAEVMAKYVSFGSGGIDQISVLVRSGDKHSAGVVADLIAKSAVKYLLSEGLKELDEAHDYVGEQAKQIEKGIQDIEEQIGKIKLNGGGTTETGTISQANDIGRQITAATLEREQNNRQIAKLTESLEQQRQNNPSINNASIDPNNRYGIPHKIAELEKANEQIGIRQSTLKQMLDKILELESRGDADKIFDLHKRMEFQYSIYQLLKKQMFDLQMRRIGISNKVHVADFVHSAGAQRTENLLIKLAVAALLGIFFGLPIAILWELARPGVRTGRDLSDAGLVYLGGIPKASSAFMLDKRTHELKLCRFDSDSELSMAFIQIRSRLLYMSDRRDMKSQVVAVVSAKPSEGKSFVVRNLAACFGHMGRKTLIIDCDMRKSVTSDFFGAMGTPGLSEVLTGTSKFGDVVRRQVTKGVDLVSSGMIKTNITDMFADLALGELLKDLRTVYDHILLDTPSMLAVPDAPMILRTADMPLLLAAMDETTRDDLHVSLDRIRALNTGEVYAILNRVSGGQVPLYLLNTGSGRRNSGASISGGPDGGRASAS